MTPAARASASRPYAEITPGPDEPIATTCEEAISRSVADDAAFALEDEHWVRAQLRGSEAVAEDAGGVCLSLALVDGEWRVAGPPLPHNEDARCGPP